MRTTEIQIEYEGFLNTVRNRLETRPENYGRPVRVRGNTFRGNTFARGPRGQEQINRVTYDDIPEPEENIEEEIELDDDF